jgi:hypothetical protein
MSDFFQRKSPVGLKIPEPGPYDFAEEDSAKACGLDRKDFTARYTKMFSTNSLDINEKSNPIASIAARFEDHFSKREMAFMLSAEIIQEIIKKEKKEEENGK